MRRRRLEQVLKAAVEIALLVAEGGKMGPEEKTQNEMWEEEREEALLGQAMPDDDEKKDDAEDDDDSKDE